MSTSSILNDTAPASSQTARVHTVTVGKGTHRFDPETVVASVGDLVKFEFYPLNHSVVRAQYGYPCIPYETMLRGQTGFFSGLVPVPSVLDNPPTWDLTINDTDPIFYYCSAPGSCLDWGMIGTINPNSSTPLQKQKTLALDAQFMLQPGESFPSEASALMSSDMPVQSAWPTLVPTSAPMHTSESPPSENGLTTPTIAGIVLGALAACCVALAALLVFFRAMYQDRRCGQKAEAVMASSPDKFTSEIPSAIPDRIPDPSVDQSPGRASSQGTIQSPCMSPYSLRSSYGDPLSPRTFHDIGPEVLEKDSKILYELPEG